MTEAEKSFLEEYNRLDKICREMFSCENGISMYILEMEDHKNGKDYVAGWERDYKLLNDLRWLKNRIAHDSGDSGIDEENDIKKITKFCDRMESRTDPLSMYAKAKKSGKKQTRRHLVMKADEAEETEAPDEVCEEEPVKNEEPAAGNTTEKTANKKIGKKKAKMYMLTAGILAACFTLVLVIILILYFAGVI